ncbi:MAG: hypothetical protein Q8R97_13825, partial [Brevundimonas sp.]|nr:hypothetical protein [Brevundimonas sp.]
MNIAGAACTTFLFFASAGGYNKKQQQLSAAAASEITKQRDAETNTFFFFDAKTNQSGCNASAKRGGVRCCSVQVCVWCPRSSMDTDAMFVHHDKK